MFLAAAKTICFEDLPCFSPAQQWLPTYAFPWWHRNFHLGHADKLQDQVSPPVCTQATFPFVSTDCYLDVFANWFWCLSAIEDHLWVWSAFGAYLPIGYDICLPLRTICENWVSFEHFCQLVLMPDYHWGLFVSGRVFVWDSTSHPRRGFVTDLFGVWMGIPFIWLVFLLPYVKWEIQVQVIKKNLAMESWLTKKTLFLDNV